MCSENDLSRCYEICYLADRDAQRGYVYCAHLLWLQVRSPFFESRGNADEWARDHGGTRLVRA